MMSSPLLPAPKARKKHGSGRAWSSLPVLRHLTGGGATAEGSQSEGAWARAHEAPSSARAPGISALRRLAALRRQNAAHVHTLANGSEPAKPCAGGIYGVLPALPRGVLSRLTVNRGHWKLEHTMRPALSEDLPRPRAAGSFRRGRRCYSLVGLAAEGGSDSAPPSPLSAGEAGQAPQDGSGLEWWVENSWHSEAGRHYSSEESRSAVFCEGLEQLPRADWLPNFKLGVALGVGTCGTVFLVRNPARSTNFALKVVDKFSMLQDQPEKVASLLREVRCLQQLDHPNVVRLLEAAQTDESVMLLMDFAGMRNLFEHQQTLAGKVFAPSDARRVHQQMASAVHHCHSRGVVHRDIKQENVVVRSGELVVVLVDFGGAHDGEAPCEQVGTLQFMAPEVMALMEADYDARKADVWSVGILLLEMLCGLNFIPRLLQWGEEPKSNDPSLPCSLWSFLGVEGELPHAMRRTLHVSEALEGTMCGLLCPRVQCRWTAAQALASAWLQER